MIVDAHCHVWPDSIAAQVLAARPAGLAPMYDGTVKGLLATMDGAGIERGVCLGVAGTARTVERTNQFIGSLDRSRLVPFGTVHPDLSPEQNLHFLQEFGIAGVKLHPLFQDLALDDPRVIDIAHALAEAGLPVITHVGAGSDEASNARGAPEALVTLLSAVPDLTVIACHFGGYHQLDEAEKHVVQSRAILETSWPPQLAELEAARVLRIIRDHGADRVVFGSDWPMADPGAELNTLRSLGLDAQEQQAILGGTLSALLGLR